jgi:TAT (twin-arginine translocation) pathway signal sequence
VQRQNASVVKLDALVQTTRHVAHRWKAIAARGRIRCSASRLSGHKRKNRKEQTTGESELADSKKRNVTRRTLLKAGAAMTAMPVLGIAAPSVLAQGPLKSPTRVHDFMTS